MRILDSDCLLTALNRDGLLELIPKGGVGIEIGVNRGAYSRKILDSAKPSVLHLVDPWPTDSADEYIATYKVKDDMAQNFELVRNTFAAEIAADSVVIHRAYSKDCAGSFKDGSLDFIYVDGMHSYAACYEDLVSFAPKLKPTGILMGHDFSNTQTGRRKQFGVIAAVRDFLARSDFMPVIVTLENAPSYVLARQHATRDRLLEAALRRAPGVLASFSTISAMQQTTVMFGAGPRKVELMRI